MGGGISLKPQALRLAGILSYAVYAIACVAVLGASTAFIDNHWLGTPCSKAFKAFMPGTNIITSYTPATRTPLHQYSKKHSIT